MRRMRWILAGIAVLVLALEASVFSHVTWRGIQPNLTLVYAVVVGLAFGPTDGALIGFWSGFLQDVYSGRHLGVYGSVHLVAGYLAGLSTLRVFREYLWLPLAVAAAATVIAESMALVLFRLFGTPVSVVASFHRVIVPMVVLNSLIAPLLYGPVLRLRLRIDELSDGQQIGEQG